MNNIKVGWCGIGNMGVPMIKNLVKAGFIVTVWNRTRQKAEVLQQEIGIGVADTPAQLVADSDFIITMLSDDAAVTEVFTGPEGILSADSRRNVLMIDMSTVSPETSEKLAALCSDKGLSYMDAPVSGSVKPAEDAQLIIMAGGKQADFEKVQPLFNAMGKQSILLGGTGAGNKAKLAINMFLAIVVQGFTESVLFAQQKGIDTATFLDIVNHGAVGSGITKLKSAAILNDNYKAAFALKHLAKDLRLASEQGMHLPAGLAVLDTYRKAAGTELADMDMIAIIKQLEKM